MCGFQVGDQVVIEGTLPHLPRTELSAEQRTGIIAAKSQAPMGPIVYIDLGWPVYAGSFDSEGTAKRMFDIVRGLNPEFAGDGADVICISEEKIVHA